MLVEVHPSSNICFDVFLAYAMTPPPGRSRLSVLNGGRKFSICMVSSEMVGFNQHSVKMCISCAMASPRTRSVLGSILKTLRCKILGYFLTNQTRLRIKHHWKQYCFPKSGLGFA